MDTPKSLRERAEQLRRLAAQHGAGTGDALLDAACELDQRALRLERAPPPFAAESLRVPAKPA